MREIVWESRECNVCGSRAQVVREASNVEACGVSFLGELEGGRLARAPRVRSVLAHTAGYAGVLYLFGRSVVPLAASRWWVESGAFFWLALGLNLLAPLALVLAFAAGISLDRSRGKSGALPAVFALLVGLWGTFDQLLMLAPWLRYLKAF